MAWSALYDDIGGAAHSLRVNRSPLLRKISRRAKSRSLKRFREVVDTVATSASINGGSAVTRHRVPATDDFTNTGPKGGGAITAESVTVIASSSTTDATDVANVDHFADFTHKPSSYPTDAAGNGGGDQQNLAHALS